MILYFRTIFNKFITMFTLSSIFKFAGNIGKPIRKNSSRNFQVPLIGESAPSFTADSTSGIINFPSDYDRDWKILLSHPMDFTPVCSTELIELAALQDEFTRLGVRLLTVSTDPLETHKQWKLSLEKIKYKDYARLEISFPIIDDSDLVIAKLYGMIHKESDNNKDVRGVFIIDPDNKIKAEFFYPMEIGRNLSELVRTVKALQLNYKKNVLTPANWEIGHDVLVPFPVKADMTNMNKESGEYYQLAWFLIFKKWIDKF